MARLLALLSYAYQAVLAFGSLLIVAHLLAPAEYALYSLFMATTQLAAIAAFEWIRFACSRFYPGDDAASEALQRGTMAREFGASLLVAASIALAAALAGLVPPMLAVLGLAVVLLQGWTDLLLTMMRFRQQFSAFSWLQGFRAIALAIGSIVGASVLGSAEGAAVGLVAGYVTMSAVALALEIAARRPPARWSMATVRQHLRYGSVSAGASVIGLVAPLGLRLILQGTFGPAAAGALLAIDLLQRPFVLVISAVHGVQYPVVVRAHDTRAADFPRQLGRYYALLVTLALLTAAGVAAILPLVSTWLVAEDMREAFVATAPAVLIVFLMRATTQNVFATPAHLLQAMRVIILLAVTDAVLLNASAAIGAALPGSTLTTVCLAAAIGSVAYAVAGIFTLRALPFATAPRPVLAALAALVLCLGITASTWTLAGAAIAMVIGSGLGVVALGLLYAEYRRTSVDSLDVA